MSNKHSNIIGLPEENELFLEFLIRFSDKFKWNYIVIDNKEEGVRVLANPTDHPEVLMSFKLSTNFDLSIDLHQTNYINNMHYVDAIYQAKLQSRLDETYYTKLLLDWRSFSNSRPPWEK